MKLCGWNCEIIVGRSVEAADLAPFLSVLWHRPQCDFILFRIASPPISPNLHTMQGVSKFVLHGMEKATFMMKSLHDFGTKVRRQCSALR